MSHSFQNSELFERSAFPSGVQVVTVTLRSGELYLVTNCSILRRRLVTLPEENYELFPTLVRAQHRCFVFLRRSTTAQAKPRNSTGNSTSSCILHLVHAYGDFQIRVTSRSLCFLIIRRRPHSQLLMATTDPNKEKRKRRNHDESKAKVKQERKKAKEPLTPV